MKIYLKFFGGHTARADRYYPVLEEIKRGESHCVAGFSKSWQPTIFEKDDIIYMARVVNKPNDYIIFGKGIVADTFKLPRDKATKRDTERLKFREIWPYYLQLTNTIFINGELLKGITIEQLIKEYENNAFERTKDGQNWRRSVRQAFCNQSYIELTAQAAHWLSQEFENRIEKHGQVSIETLSQIPYPENCFNNNNEL